MKTLHRPLACLIASLLLLAAAPAPAAPIAHREVLPNGIVLLVAERPGVPIVAVRVFLRAGAAFEPKDHAGLANLTDGTPVQGTIESVGKLPRDDVVDFHRTHVRPDTTIVAVVGDITVDEARGEILKRFGGWTRPATPAPTASPAPGGGPPRSETITKDLTQA